MVIRQRQVSMVRVLRWRLAICTATTLLAFVIAALLTPALYAVGIAVLVAVGMYYLFCRSTLDQAEHEFDDMYRYKLAVDNAGDHIVITDKYGVTVYANDAIERTTGYTPSEAIGKKAGSKELWGGVMDDEVYQALWKRIGEEKKPWEGELVNRRKDGTKYHVYATIAPILDTDDDIRYFVGIERDITEQKVMDEAKTDFVSLASHQLRTPLSAIKWYAEMLLDEDVGPITDGQRDYLQEIHDGNLRMIQLVDNLLNISRLDLGSYTVEPKLVSFHKLIEKLAKESELAANEKGIKVVHEVADNVPLLPLDETLASIVIDNLVDNAVMYSPQGMTVHVSVRLVEKGEHVDGRVMAGDGVLIAVEDHGCGIPIEAREKIFTKLYRADNARELIPDGNGLGLYLVKKIVEYAGGHVWFNSSVGKGTTFFVWFPDVGMTAREGTTRLERI